MLAMPTTSVVACPSGACATCECINRSQRHVETIEPIRVIMCKGCSWRDGLHCTRGTFLSVHSYTHHIGPYSL